MAIAGGLASFWVCLVAEDRGGVPVAVARGLAHLKAELIANSQEGNAPAPIRKEGGLATAGGLAHFWVCLGAGDRGGAPAARGLAHLKA